MKKTYAFAAIAVTIILGGCSSVQTNPYMTQSHYPGTDQFVEQRGLLERSSAAVRTKPFYEEARASIRRTINEIDETSSYYKSQESAPNRMNNIIRSRMEQTERMQ